MIKYIEQNRELFRFWIRRNEKLQSSNEIFKPIIEPFLKDNPGVNIDGCPECLIDMLRWALKQIKTPEDAVKSNES